MGNSLENLICFSCSSLLCGFRASESWCPQFRKELLHFKTVNCRCFWCLNLDRNSLWKERVCSVSCIAGDPGRPTGTQTWCKVSQGPGRAVKGLGDMMAGSGLWPRGVTWARQQVCIQSPRGRAWCWLLTIPSLPSVCPGEGLPCSAGQPDPGVCTLQQRGRPCVPAASREPGAASRHHGPRERHLQV